MQKYNKRLGAHTNMYGNIPTYKNIYENIRTYI